MSARPEMPPAELFVHVVVKQPFPGSGRGSTRRCKRAAEHRVAGSPATRLFHPVAEPRCRPRSFAHVRVSRSKPGGEAGSMSVAVSASSSVLAPALARGLRQQVTNGEYIALSPLTSATASGEAAPTSELDQSMRSASPRSRRRGRIRPSAAVRRCSIGSCVWRESSSSSSGRGRFGAGSIGAPRTRRRHPTSGAPHSR